MSNPFKKPKAPEPTEREQGLRLRQERALDRERDQELRRRRLILSGRLGMRQLLSGSAAGIMQGGAGGGSPSSGRAGSVQSVTGAQRQGQAQPRTSSPNLFSFRPPTIDPGTIGSA